MTDIVERLRARGDELSVEAAGLIHALSDAAQEASITLELAASRCDRWANDSRSSGWSTHQVIPNLQMADALRRRASMTRRAIPARAAAEAAIAEGVRDE